MMRRAVILQPGYLPWLGFYDLLYKAHIFVVLDDVQYTVRDWRNRNRIKTPDGVLWLTVPVKAKNVREKTIKNVEIDYSQDWRRRHLQCMESFYKKAKHFNDVFSLVCGLYEEEHRYLISFNMQLITKIAEYLVIDTDIIFSSEIPAAGEKDIKLLSICKNVKATHYLSGNAAKNYLREPLFAAESVKVEWHHYQHPFYHQLWMERHGFISHLSVTDLLFNHGPESLDILLGRKSIPNPVGIRIRHANEV